jgi:hypothetical protein
MTPTELEAYDAMMKDRDHWKERALKAEAERDNAIAREKAVLHFCEIEMGWEYFRAEYKLSDANTVSLQNARKLQAFLEQHRP